MERTGVKTLNPSKLILFPLVTHSEINGLSCSQFFSRTRILGTRDKECRQTVYRPSQGPGVQDQVLSVQKGNQDTGTWQPPSGLQNFPGDFNMHFEKC
jgi:hypothetical protein